MSKPAIQICLELLSVLSLPALYRIANLTGFAIRNTRNQVSLQTRENIELCFGQLDKRQQKILYRDTIRHTCYSMVELAAIWCWPANKILAQIKQQDICDAYTHSSRGKIVIAPHLGSWELLGIWLGRESQSMILYKRIKNSAIDQFVNTARGRSGGTPIPTKKHGLRKLLVALKENGNALILPDQRPARSKVHIESKFFGISAPTTTLVQNLCSKVDCDVFLATVYRTKIAGEFGLSITQLDAKLLAGEATASAQYMNDQIEQLVDQYPEQYEWGYRRFANTAYTSGNDD